jgi:apolipoprotein N-acyltransferase
MVQGLTSSRTQRVNPIAVVMLAGAAQAIAVASPWSGQPVWWLQLLSLAVLVWQLERSAERAQSWIANKGSNAWTGKLPAPAPARRAFWLGWAFALSWLVGSFWWLFISMHTYGGLHPLLAGLAVLALAGALALIYGAACAAFIKLFSAPAPAGRTQAAIVFAALWTLAELSRGRWLTGFPWGAGAYAHTGGPLAGYAPWIGVYGVGALAAWTGATLARLRSSGTVQRVALLAVLALPSAATLAPGLWDGGFTQSSGRLTVQLLQGNIPQDEKFEPGTGVLDSLRWYGEQLKASQASLVVAPETAIPLLMQQLPEGYWAALTQVFSSGRQAALVGIPMGSSAEGYTNSVLGLKPGSADSPGSASYRYDKFHLVPFGEFIPPLFKWFTEMMNIPLGDFNRGALGQSSFEWQGQRLAPNVCYEDLFGEELGARFIDPASAPTMFVNVSNIGWFGDTVAIDQHLQISRMRALEFQRPMIRATNTGATVIIDHTGRVTHALPRLTRAVLTGEAEGRSGITPYAWWVSRVGLWPLWLAAMTIVLVAFRARFIKANG